MAMNQSTTGRVTPRSPAAVMSGLASAIALGLAVLLPATPAHAEAADPLGEVLYAVVPVTPEQAHELVNLFRSPGIIVVDVVEATGVVIETVAELPAALIHDVVTAPIRDWHLLRGLVTDTVDLVIRPAGTPRGLFRDTVHALHRSRVFTAAASAVRRITQPTNRTARLSIVLTARAQGLPARAEHLDLLNRAIDRNDPDLAPLLVSVVEGLTAMHGRDAVRLLLTLGR
jgi:hypothetical protein